MTTMNKLEGTKKKKFIKYKREILFTNNSGGPSSASVAVCG
jgi:hypothetical protein